MTSQSISTDLSTTRTAFAPFNIPNGETLIIGTYRRLLDRDFRSVQLTQSFQEALIAAFKEAFINQARLPLLPTALSVSLPVASARAIEHCDSGGDLLSELLPTFFDEAVAAFRAAASVGYDTEIRITAHRE